MHGDRNTAKHKSLVIIRAQFYRSRCYREKFRLHSCTK